MKQTPIARKYAKMELEKGCDWSRNQLDEMLKLFRVNRFGEISRADKKEYEALETLNKYPNYLLNTWTWNRFFSGILLEDDILEQLISFYKNYYKDFLSELKKAEYESSIPILLVTYIPELIHHAVYPVITDYGIYKSCIVLVINEQLA